MANEATQLQLRRGTTAENDAFTGAQGELTIDTDLNQLRVHDGTTPGGRKVPLLTGVIPDGGDYVVSRSAKGSNPWYELWASGKLRCGGTANANSSSSAGAITFPMEFEYDKVDDLTITLSNGRSTSNPDYTAFIGPTNVSGTGMTLYCKGYGGSGTAYNCGWVVEGYVKVS